MQRYINIPFISKILERDKYKEFDSIRLNKKNKNISLYSERLLKDYIYSRYLLKGRNCKHCLANEVSHFYPSVLKGLNTKVCEDFEARQKYCFKLGLAYMAESNGSINERDILRNITIQAFNDLKLTNCIN